MMKQIIFAIFASALFLVGMTGCTVEDNPAADGLNPQEQSLVGLWWDEFKYDDVTEAGVPFSRALLAVDIEADHSGCIYLGVFDGSSDEPVAVYGGPDDAGFKWQMLPDGSVELIDPATNESRVVTRADNGGNFGKDMTNVAATKVTVTDGGMTVTKGSYSGNLTKADARKKAEIEQKLAAAIQYKLLSDATPEDYGKIVCEAGHLHKARQKVPEGCVAVGILGKVTSPGNGLILALHNARMESWWGIKEWASETRFAGTTLKILPDDGARGYLESYTQLGDVPVSNWGVGRQSDYESIFKNFGSTKNINGQGVTFDWHVNAYLKDAGGREFEYLDPVWTIDQQGNPFFTSGMCFDGFEWHGKGANYLESVRPLLGFFTAPETAPQGAITGAFTIGNGKKVFFAKGNLQYVGIWQFAEHQWDCFGTDQRDDHRDLFGWGTANNPNNVSTNVADYSWSEWGANAIANAATGYRTLTFDECAELFRNLRNSNHSGLATVNGVRGVVMLCDRWTLPGGCTFKPIPEDTYNDWNSNTYTAEQWAAMEAAGAVFLPCAGQRNGTLTELVNVYPFYWLGSKLSANEAYGLSYTNRLAIPIAPFSAGLSVRLVKDAE